MQFHDFTLFVVLSLFTGGSPNAEKNILPALGEPAGKRERTTNNAKSYNGIGLILVTLNVIVSLEKGL